jgi:predicted permease
MWNETRHAYRRLRATPLVTLCAIACLSIGVWMTCIVTAVGNGFFRPRLGVPGADRLVQIDEVGLFTRKRELGFTDRMTSQSVLDSLVSRKLFGAVGFYEPTTVSIVGERRGRGAAMLSSGMMDVLSVHVALGRRFLPADDSVPGMMISHDLWRTMFGSDPAVIGRRVHLNWYRATLPIVGVAEHGFAFPRNGQRTDVYLSAGVGSGPKYPSRKALARLRDGQSVGDVRPVVREIAMRNVAADRETMTRYWRATYRRTKPPELAMGPVDVQVARYNNEPTGRMLVNFLLLVLGCGSAVVLIAASNVINLLLIRGATRRQEIAVRLALGASRAQIVAGLVIEAALVAAVGSVVGFALAVWQWRQIDSGFDGRDWFGHIDGATLPVAIASGFVLTLVVGVWPGLRATSINLEQVLRDTRRTGINASPLDGLLGRLIAASTAATVVLLVCASLLGLSARDWLTERTGLQQKGLTSLLSLDPAISRGQRADLALAALARARAVAGGVRTAVLGAVPADAESRSLHATVDGGVARRLSSTQTFDVSDGYFDAMRIPILGGRGLSAIESRDSTAFVVISRGVATTLFGGQTPVGRRFRYWADADSIVYDAIVVGVAENLADQNKLQLYHGYGWSAPEHIPLLIAPRRSGADVVAINRALRATRGVLSSDLTTIEKSAGRAQAYPLLRYMVIGFTLFAVVGMVLAAIGTYGIVSYSVVRRTHEIGVRIALGADRSKVTWMILEHGLKISLIGAALGLALSFAAARILGSLVSDMNTNYPLAMVGVVLFVMLVSVIACFIPGHRAGSLNPVDALRAE